MYLFAKYVEWWNKLLSSIDISVIVSLESFFPETSNWSCKPHWTEKRERYIEILKCYAKLPRPLKFVLIKHSPTLNVLVERSIFQIIDHDYSRTLSYSFLYQQNSISGKRRANLGCYMMVGRASDSVLQCFTVSGSLKTVKIMICNVWMILCSLSR